MTYHISGHGDLTAQEFETHYVSKIDSAVAQNCEFVIGDFRGTDKMAIDYLRELGYDKVTVYHMFDSPRVDCHGYPTKGGYTSDVERDTAMTMESDDDICWIKPGRERSGTAKNLRRRQRLIAEK